MTDSEFVETAMARFHFARRGSGSPVLLLPGAGGWRLTFDAMFTALSQRHTVYALDPPGQGLTVVRDPGFGYDADAIASSIRAFLDAVGVRRPAIVGHSWGGGFALRFAELFRDRVSKLALLAPGGLDVKDVWEFRLVRLPVLGELAVRLVSKASMRHMLRKSFANPERIPEELEDLVAEQVKVMRSGRDQAARLKAMLRVERSVRWTETERDLDRVRTPVLLLWGSEDRYLPVELIDRFTARLVNVESHVFQGCGHSLHDECPEWTHALLDPFLGSEPPCR